MNAPVTLPAPSGAAPAVAGAEALPALIDRAASALARARTAAEVLEAEGLADLAYGTAQHLAKLLKMRGAHDDVVGAALRAQADALLIEAQAKIRLADEYEAAKERGEVARQGERTDLLPVSEKVPTLADIGLTHDKIFRARQIRDAERAEPGALRRIVDERLAEGLAPTKDALRAGVKQVLSFASEADLDAHVKMRRAQRQAGKADKRAEREVGLGDRTRAAAAELGARVYATIYADPPWPHAVWSAETGMDRSPENHYPTMTVEEIMELVVPAAPTCGLFLWVPDALLDVGIDVLRGWGFSYKCSWIWVKPRIGLGYWNRKKHEQLLFGTRGHLPAPAPGQQWASVIEAALGRHSEKPLDFARMVEGYFPTSPKVELFARAPREGWDAWGNEAGGAP